MPRAPEDSAIATRRPAAHRQLLAGLSCLLLAAAASAASPRATPPAIYAKSLAPLLTPADALPALADAPAGAVLLDETLHFVADDLGYYRVEHRIERTGATPLRIAARVLPASQQIWLALARSKPAGGEWRSDGVSLDQGGSEAVGELIASFPGLAAGSLAETVFVIEEPVLPLAGEFTALLTFYGERPTGLARAVVELPAALAGRLAAVPVGAAPAEERAALAGGRIRSSWSAANPPPGRSAAIWLSTLGSWDRLADWYRGHLAGHGELPAGLREEARAATAAAAGPREAAAILYRRVADGLRGTPSALGSAPAVPRSPAEVWAAGRGDSLDKAALLRALLAENGISSTVALINSRDSGAIETRSPDFRHFDRALLRVELPAAGAERARQLWADPSQPFLELGQLGLGDGERPAFLVPAAGGWSFATTPRASPPKVSPETLGELARRGDPRLAAAILAALEAGDPAELATKLGATVRQLEEGGASGAANRLYLALEQVAPRRAELEAARAELERYFEARAAIGQNAGIARELARLFAESPPSFWAATPLLPAADAAADAGQVAALEKEERIAPFLRQTVHLLTTWPPGPDFSTRLYQVAYTLGRHYPDEPQADGLLALLALLPKNDPNYWEGQALAGRRLAARGEADAALALYRRLAADPALPPAFASVFTTLAAETELQKGRKDGAAAGFATLERTADTTLPIVADGLLQGALLALEDGRPEEAAGYLRKLLEVDDKVVAASSSPRQALGLRELARDEKALRRAWSSWQAWWPSWLELEAAWPGGAEPDDGVLLLGDLELLGQRFGALLAQGQGRAAFGILRRLAHAARWDPQLALELSGSLVYLGTARPELAAKIHETAIILHRALPPFADPDDAARSRLLLAAHLIDGGRPAEALEPLRDLLSLKVGGALAQRGVTLLAMVALATGRGQEQAAGELAAAMDDSFPPELRPTAVQHLADLYHRLDRPLEERRLLEKELTRPELAASPQRAELAARLAAIRAGSDLFAETVAAWRARFPLPVLAVAEPASLADPRLAGRNEAQMLEGDWLPPEKVKIAFLLAADAKRPPEARAAAVAAILPELRACLPLQGAYRAMLQGVADERRFPAPLRSAAAFWLAYSWLQHENLAAADAFLARAAGDLNTHQRANLAALRILPAAKKAGPEALESYAEGLLGRELSGAEAQLFPELWRTLALLGPEGAAERLLPRLERLAVAGDPATAASLRETARGHLPDLLALRQLRASLGRRFAAAAPLARPPLVDELASPQLLESLAPADCRGLLRYDLETLELGLAATAAWPAAFAACQDQGQGELQAELALTIAGSGLTDAAKAEALLGAAGQLSDDDPAWPNFLEKLATATGDGGPLTRETARLLALGQHLRAGQKIDLAALLQEVSPERRPWVRVWQQNYLLHQRDPAAAKKFLAGLTPDELTAPFGLAERLELAELAAAPEKKEIESAARRQIYLARLSSLASQSWSEARRALRLAAALVDQQEFPETKEILAATANPLGRLSLELAAAEVAADWPRAYEAARQMIPAENVDYDDYWNLARAAARAGKKEEARAALETFLEKTHGHPAEKEARELQTRLAGG